MFQIKPQTIFLRDGFSCVFRNVGRYCTMTLNDGEREYRVAFQKFGDAIKVDRSVVTERRGLTLVGDS